MSKFLVHEKKNLGGYSLIFPTDQYENQPTTGRKVLYENLLGNNNYYQRNMIKLLIIFL